ncbi:MAG TPA: PrsW family glutamic-type intramembrane protease [Spirochaetia bacterium]|nr:PrsW family glutamic-type intramembrane protease [Spirochaetia bacterium]
MPILFSVAMAVVPALVLLVYYYRQDRNKPEPKGLILKVFVIGVVSTLPAILLELLVSAFEDPAAWPPLFFALFEAFIVAALCEEFIKLSVVRLFAYNNVSFDEVMDGIVYTVVASLGFACMENILYVLDKGWVTAVLRAFTAVPMHALASGMMGFYIGKAKFAASKQEEKSLIKRGLFVAIGIHGAYDFLLFIVPLYGLIPAAGIIPILILTYRALRRKIREAVQEDTELGRA